MSGQIMACLARPVARSAAKGPSTSRPSSTAGT